MKKFFIFLFLLLFSLRVDATVLEAGISIDDVPKNLFGQWRVEANLDDTNALRTFKSKGIDFWNLIRVGDVLKLENPYSHAKSEMSLENVEGNIVVFSKKQAYDDNRILTDTITIRLNQNEFSGINTLKLEYFSLIDNHLMKTETATYHIKGEKISGDSVVGNDNTLAFPNE